MAPRKEPAAFGVALPRQGRKEAGNQWPPPRLLTAGPGPGTHARLPGLVAGARNFGAGTAASAPRPVW